MYNFSIGVIIDSFGIHSGKLTTKDAITKAAQIGADGLQMYGTSGQNSPDNLTKSKRKELLDFVKSQGLRFSAICGDFGVNFAKAENNPLLLEKSKRILELALDLECNIVTTHIGIVPKDQNSERFSIMHDACYEMAQFADRCNAHFAIETGPETASTLRAFLDTLDSKGVAVNLDPANLVMVTGDDPVKAVYTLSDYIVHTHAKDGIKLMDFAPESLYENPNGDFDFSKAFDEVVLGTGGVDFPAYLKALNDIGYNGFLTIERECGANPEDDIKIAMEFLKNCIAEGKNNG